MVSAVVGVEQKSMLFKIRFWPTVAVVSVVLLTTALGFWQRSRAHEKEARQARIEQFARAPAIPLNGWRLTLPEVEYHRVSARGRFLPQWTVYLENRPYHDQAGFYVVMPLQLDGGGTVLVKRGWLPRNLADRTAIALYRTPVGPVQITGIARADASRVFTLGRQDTSSHPKIRENLAIEAYAREIGLPLLPFVIEQTSGNEDGSTPDGLVRDWPAPNMGIERNYGYMLQWWAMAIAAILFGLYAAYRAAHPAAASRGKGESA
jgi:cytochrome oxidase assembly protein ShyY1